MSIERKHKLSATERRIKKCIESLASTLGHADRIAPFPSYATGLLATRVAPDRVRAAHQSLHHFIAQAEWSDRAVLAKVYESVLPAVQRHGPVRPWIVDDTGIPKKGSHSVGVSHQYCGLVELAHLRWRIERDYQELKDELGLGHYEGRSWRCFHHHATHCIAAYGFPSQNAALFPPVAMCALPSGNLPDPTTSNREALPVRAERHNKYSIVS